MEETNRFEEEFIHSVSSENLDFFAKSNKFERTPIVVAMEKFGFIKALWRNRQPESNHLKPGRK